MKIYDANGWVNWQSILSEAKGFLMVVGPRGTGKTYGLLKELVKRKEPFIYLRRLKTQLDECCKISGNPFKKINSDLGLNIIPVSSASSVVYYNSINNDGKAVVDSAPVAYGLALSTYATMRGADYSDVNYIVFDEAIASVGEKPIRDEFNAFLNLYETVNRNRELEGKAPVTAVLLGNANKLANPYFLGWRFMRTALKMIRGKQMVYRSEDRIMIMLLNSPISEKKKSTVLYKNANNDFLQMAIDNSFKTDETNIKSRKLIEYRHIVSVGELGIYSHKNTGELYISPVTAKPYYEGYGIYLTMFIREYSVLKIKYLEGKITFQDYESELIFRNYFDLI